MLGAILRDQQRLPILELTFSKGTPYKIYFGFTIDFGTAGKQGRYPVDSCFFIKVALFLILGNLGWMIVYSFENLELCQDHEGIQGE